MKINHKHSKIEGMKRRQEGMASVLVVSVLIVIMTLISIGFARIMNRSLANSSNRQSSAAATYVAQSGVNDVADYIKTHPTAYSNSCHGNDSLIGSDPTAGGTAGPFWNDANNVGGAGSTAKYTCILLNQFPQDLLYQQVAANKTRVTRVNTTAFPGFLGKLMLSWQSSVSQNNGYPTSSSSLDTQTNWNTASSGICQQGGTAAGCVPILKVSLYPVPVGGDMSQVQSKSKTIYLYPQGGVGNMSHPSYSALNDGSIMPITCSTSIGSDGSGNPYFNGSTNYSCNIIIQDLDKIYLSPAQIDYVYAKITPIYGQADVRIEANDAFRQVVNFKYTQAMIDVTGTYGGVAKRLQARVDTSTFTDTAGVYKEDDNLGSNNDVAPDEALRTANAACKRAVVIADPAFSYIAFDSPSSVCHDADSSGGSSSGSVPLPNPQLTLYANGVKYDTASPAAPYTGIYYLPYGVSSSTITWQSGDATDCTAQAPSVGWGFPGVTSGWSGSQKAYMTFSGTGNATGNGSRGVTVDTSQVTSFGLQCSRVSLPSNVTSPARTVTLWPYPTARISGPGSVEAGQNYTISWSSTGAVRCALSGPWTDASQTGTSGSETMNWPWWDTSTKTFSVNCYDPAGRASSAGAGASTWTIGPGVSSSSGSTGGSNGVSAPSCSGNINPNAIEYNGGGFQWSVSCPNVSPSSGGYHYDITGPSPQSGDGYGASSGIWFSPQGGRYCMSFVAWVPGWGSSGSPNWSQTVCQDIYTIAMGSFQALVWDEGPSQCNAASGANGQWLCRNNASVINTSNGCPDGFNRFEACAGDVNWSWAFQNSGTLSSGANVTCTAKSNNSFYGNFYTGTDFGSIGGHSMGHLSWGGSGSPYTFTVTCTGPTGSSSMNWNPGN